MSALAVEQLDLYTLDTPDRILSDWQPRLGRVLYTRGGGWRARWTGPRFGWVFDRAITWLEETSSWLGRRWGEPDIVVVAGWESWEPDLPYGEEHVTDRAQAEAILRACVTSHGDDPDWLRR